MKKIMAAAAVIAAMLLCGICCRAEETVSAVDTDDLYDSLGIDDSEISDNIPDEAKRIFSENGITVSDSGDFAEIDPSDIINYILDSFRSNLTYPLRVLGTMICAAMLSAAVSAFSSASDSRTAKVYEIMSVLITTAAVSAPAADCINSMIATMKAGGVFMLSYVPVYAGIAISSGSVTGAAAYNMTVMAVSEGAVQLSSHVLLPLMSMCMAMGIIDGINPDFSLGAVTSLIGKIVSFVIGVVMTVFTGMLALQNALGTAADTVGVKAAKLAVANLVPVVGGALSDTYTAVRSGLALLRNAAGIYGIAAVALTVLPPVIEAASLYLAVNIGGAFAEMLGQNGIAKLLKNISGVIGMAMSLLLCYGAMLIISTGILMYGITA